MGYNVKSVREDFKKSGIFYTPRPLAEYMRSFLPEKITEVYDPTCGHGSLLEIFPDAVKKYGQDINPEAVEAARAIPNSEIVCDDTLLSPAFVCKKFRAIIANPPFSVKWSPDLLKDDARFTSAPCFAPPSKADFAFLLHILHYIKCRKDVMDARFLFHLLQSARLERLNTSSTVPSLPREKLANMVILVPPLAYQREAARVLDGMLTEIGSIEDAMQRLSGIGTYALEEVFKLLDRGREPARRQVGAVQMLLSL